MRRLIALLTAFWLAGWANAQETPSPGPRIDVENYEIELEVVPDHSYVRGSARIAFQVLEDAVSVPFDLNSRISLIEVVDEEGVVYSPSFDNFNSSRMAVRGDQPFRAGTNRTLTFTFDGTLDAEDYAFLDNTPRTEKAVVNLDSALLLSEGHWFPSHNLPVDAATATLKINVPLGFTVVGPGRLEGIETVGISETFEWRSDRPASYFPVAVNRFFRQNFDDLTRPATFYVTEDFKADLQPVARNVDEVTAFFSDLHGDAALPERLNFVQVGDVQLASPGAPGLTLLEAPLLTGGTPPLMELARRIALQWWGSGLHLRRGEDVWLQDAFAEYDALRYLEVKHPGRDEAELAKLAVQALKYEQRASIASGLNLGQGTPQYDSVVRAKGAWVLYMLRQLIGEEKFHSILDDWYRQNAGRAVSTSEFVEFVNANTGDDYRWFFVQWVESTGVPEFRVEYTILKKSAGGFRIRGQIKQDQELFRMPVDVQIQTKGKPEEKRLNLSGKVTSFNFETETFPQRVEIDPEGKILRDSEKMRVAVNIALGDEYREQGEFVSAIREYEKAKTQFPLSSLAHYRLGETFFLQHSYTNAANSFRDALNGDLKPDWVETWTHIHLGKIYDILGQRQRALAEYQKAVNSKIDYNGAQAEARKYIETPYSKPSSLIN